MHEKIATTLTRLGKLPVLAGLRRLGTMGEAGVRYQGSGVRVIALPVSFLTP